MPRSRSADERVRYGRLVQAFIRAGWNPPRPDDRVTHAILDDIARASSQATLDPYPTHQRILELMAQGLTRAQIADEMGIGFETLRGYQRELYRRLGARNGPHAVALGFRGGWLW